MTVALSDEVWKKCAELFAGTLSTLKVTDPEARRVFDNFAFDRVTVRQPRQEHASQGQLAAVIVCQALMHPATLRMMLESEALANTVNALRASVAGSRPRSHSLRGRLPPGE